MDPILAGLSSLSSARSIEELTRPLLDMLGTVTGMESTYLTSIDMDADLQHVRFARNVGEMQIPEGLSVPWEDTLCKRALDERRMYTDDVASCWGDSDAARLLGIKTYLSAPIEGEEGKVLGTLCAASSRRLPVGTDAQAVLRLFASMVGNFIERERLVEQLRDANGRLLSYALTDALTNLPNRRAAFDQLQRLLERAARERTSVLVGVVDLDGFKRINDTHGHQAGDLFLQEISRRMSASLRASDMLGRMGGDEFVLVGPGPALAAVPADAAVVAAGEALSAAAEVEQRACASTVGRFVLGGVELDYGGASVAVLALCPDGLDAEAAVRLADARMYEIKRARKGLH